MKEINNLIYTLEINYTNKSGLDNSIIVEFNDNGLQMRSFAIGNVCIKEETINGRVLSGRLDNLDGFCGYRYNYQNGENLININPQVPIDTAVTSINKKKMELDFISAELVLSSIIRNDYRVVTLNKGNLKITRTISAENEKFEHCSIQECAELLKLDGEERFVEQDKKVIYRIADECVIEESTASENNNLKPYLIKLYAILNKYPQSYKELIELKSKIQKTTVYDSTNEENLYE